METHALRGLRLPLRNPNPITPPSRSAIPSRSRRPVHCAVRFRPCIDIHKGKVKQIVGSTLRDSNDGAASLITNFESDKSPAEFARLYKQDGLTGGHVIMLGADADSRAAAIEALHAYPGGMQVGGGINLDNALSYLEEGASHVIVTSFVFRDGQMDLERLKDLVQMIGKHRLVLDLSCRKKNGKYAIVTDRWQKFSDVFLDKQTLKYLAKYADEFLVHGVDVEGKNCFIVEPALESQMPSCSDGMKATGKGGTLTLLVLIVAIAKGTKFQALRSGRISVWCENSAHCRTKMGSSSLRKNLRMGVLCDTFKLGIDEALVALLGRYSPIPVTYAGGVTAIEDMDRIKAAGGGHVDATVGSALDIFGGNLPYKTVVAWHAKEAMALH